MKLTEEMNLELRVMPMTDGDTDSTPLKTGSSSTSPLKNSKPILSNGKHEENSLSANICNGNTSSAINGIEETDALGFEVESYNDLNSSPSGSESLLKGRGDSIKSANTNEVKRTRENGEIDSNCVSEKVSIDDSLSDNELALNTSHLSEDFELRLSDDEDGNEIPQRSNFQSSDSAAGLSEQITKLTSHFTKEDGRTNNSGPGNCKNFKDTASVLISQPRGNTDSIDAEMLAQDNETTTTGASETSSTNKNIGQIDGQNHNTPDVPQQKIPGGLDTVAEEMEVQEQTKSTSSSTISISGDLKESVHDKSKYEESILLGYPGSNLEGNEEKMKDKGGLMEQALSDTLQDKLEAEIEAELEAELLEQKQKANDSDQIYPFNSEKIEKDEKVSNSGHVEESKEIQSDSGIKKSALEVDFLKSSKLEDLLSACEGDPQLLTCLKTQVLDEIEEKISRLEQEKLLKEKTEIKEEAVEHCTSDVERKVAAQQMILIKTEKTEERDGLDNDSIHTSNLEVKVKSEPIDPTEDFSQNDQIDMKSSVEVFDKKVFPGEIKRDDTLNIPGALIESDGSKNSDSLISNFNLVAPLQDKCFSSGNIDSTLTSDSSRSPVSGDIDSLSRTEPTQVSQNCDSVLAVSLEASCHLANKETNVPSEGSKQKVAECGSLGRALDGGAGEIPCCLKNSGLSKKQIAIIPDTQESAPPLSPKNSDHVIKEVCVECLFKGDFRDTHEEKISSPNKGGESSSINGENVKHPLKAQELNPLVERKVEYPPMDKEVHDNDEEKVNSQLKANSSSLKEKEVFPSDEERDVCPMEVELYPRKEEKMGVPITGNKANAAKETVVCPSEESEIPSFSDSERKIESPPKEKEVHSNYKDKRPLKEQEVHPSNGEKVECPPMEVEVCPNKEEKMGVPLIGNEVYAAKERVVSPSEGGEKHSSSDSEKIVESPPKEKEVYSNDNDKVTSPLKQKEVQCEDSVECPPIDVNVCLNKEEKLEGPLIQNEVFRSEEKVMTPSKKNQACLNNEGEVDSPSIGGKEVCPNDCQEVENLVQESVFHPDDKENFQGRPQTKSLHPDSGEEVEDEKARQCPSNKEGANPNNLENVELPLKKNDFYHSNGSKIEDSLMEQKICSDKEGKEECSSKENQVCIKEEENMEIDSGFQSSLSSVGSKEKEGGSRDELLPGNLCKEKDENNCAEGGVALESERVSDSSDKEENIDINCTNIGIAATDSKVSLDSDRGKNIEVNCDLKDGKVPDRSEIEQNTQDNEDSLLKDDICQALEEREETSSGIAEDKAVSPKISNESLPAASFTPFSPNCLDLGSEVCDLAEVESESSASSVQCYQQDSDEEKENDEMDDDKLSEVEKSPTPKLDDLDNSSSAFCESTVLNAPSVDEMDSKDCPVSPNENTISKGLCDSSSRKRTLSQSEDDSSDSFRSKKINGYLGSNESSEASNSVFGTQIDSGLKRPADNTLDSDSKKLRVSDKPHFEEFDFDRIFNSTEDCAASEAHDTRATKSSSSQPTDFPFLRQLHKKELSRLSRSDLEELVLQKMCEAISERSDVGVLRLRCEFLEQRQEKEKEKFQKLQKQMTELTLIMKKYMDNIEKNKPAPPIKVTRSVGLQVCQGIRMIPMNCPNQPKPVQPVSKVPVTPTTQTKPVATSNSPLKTSAKPQTIQKKTTSTPPMAKNNILNEPPALVPTCSYNSVVMPIVNKQAMTPPQIPPVPPLHQISTGRPRQPIPTSVSSTPPQSIQAPKHQSTPHRPSPPQNANRKTPTRNDVEVIDIIDKEEHRPIRPAVSSSSVQNQQQFQQKQSATAAAQSLAGNSGMTVRLISPTQVSQAGVTVPTGYSQLLVPPHRMIITPTSQAPIRGNVKLVMKSSSTGNVLMSLQPNSAVSSSVVHIPSSAQAAVQQIFTNAPGGARTSTVATARQTQLHPAPLPPSPLIQPSNPSWKQIPPRPNLKIQHQHNGIVLSWNMALGPAFADIESYQLFAYQEGVAPPSAGLWKKVGDVKALPLPMACTLTQFVEGHRYHFTVRAVDKHGRVGPFSQQGSIRLES